MNRLCVGLLVICGCASAPVQPAPPQPSGGLVGLEAEPDRALWRRQEPVTMSERPRLDGWVAFDGRGIKDQGSRELVWQAVAAVLSGMSEPASVMAQAELEPGESTSWNVYFLVQAETEREATLWRFQRADAPGELVLSVVTEKGRGDTSVSIWLATGVAEPVSTSWKFVREANGCTAFVVDDIAIPTTKVEDSACAVSLSVLQAVLFDAYSGSAYLSEPDVQTPTDFWPGDLERRDRQIDEVLSGSVFPPRMTF